MRNTAFILAVAFSCAACQPSPAPLPTSARTAAASPKPAAPVELPSHAIHNLHQLSERIYSGSSPDNDQSFAELKSLGVTTIISVDGAAPDADMAAAVGMRYIHLPIGYDKIPDDKAVLLAQAIKQTQGKVFVHCHHGKHRGPAAAAVCAMTDEGWTNARAIAWLKQAGTSADYPGLYRSVESFQAPDDATLLRPVDFPARAAVPALAKAMVDVDARWERLLASRKADFNVPPAHPDVDPPHEALQLAEAYREMARTKEAVDKGEDFVARLKNADEEAARLHEALKAIKAGKSDALLKRASTAADAVARNCKSCHARYRN